MSLFLTWWSSPRVPKHPGRHSSSLTPVKTSRVHLALTSGQIHTMPGSGVTKEWHGPGQGQNQTDRTVSGGESSLLPLRARDPRVPWPGQSEPTRRVGDGRLLHDCGCAGGMPSSTRHRRGGKDRQLLPHSAGLQDVSTGQLCGFHGAVCLPAFLPHFFPSAKT